jgi:hypothetical protein
MSAIPIINFVEEHGRIIDILDNTPVKSREFKRKTSPAISGIILSLV